ncbi:MAG: MFS transporter [Oscillospiraceae bacterium]|nr:MFS transporter [Oscillospiraceae bacterium]
MQNCTAGEVLALREKNYRRNYIALLLEGFFFSFALTMFSYTTVLPIYVSKLSDNAMLISLISVLYYGLGYGSSIFSAVIGVNARSPKWSSILVCSLQRVGFILIFLSTYMTTGDTALALTLFFFSFGVYSVSAGMASPMFAQLVSTVIHRNTGGFYGSYTVAGALSGVLASTVMTRIFERCGFPGDYRRIFLIGTLAALAASAIVAVGIKEVTADRSAEKIRFRELFQLMEELLKKDAAFRGYALVKALVGAAEFSIPYFIVKVGALTDAPAGFVGTMTTVLLVCNMLAGKVMGWLGDRRGPQVMLTAACASGAAAAAVALWMPGYLWSFPLFLFVSLASQGVYLSGSLAAINYSKRVRTPLYSALLGLVSSPVYIAASLLGGLLSGRTGVDAVFIAALVVYALCAELSFAFSRKRRGEQTQ